MRNLLNLLLGSAAVVGFETMFGLSKWKPWQADKPKKTGDMSLLPGGITYVNRTVASYMQIQQLRQGFDPIFLVASR